MKILNEFNEEITLHEALQLLEKYDQCEELRGLVYKIANKANLDGSAYSHDYGDLIEKHNKEVFTDEEIDKLLKINKSFGELVNLTHLLLYNIRCKKN